MQKNLRDAIIDVATELFMDKGYLATSTRDIASILNVSQPSIYHHYKNKETIYAEVLKRFATSIGSSLKGILVSQEPFHKRLVDTSIYLKNNHAVNFPLMMNDIENELGPEAQRAIFVIWQENYFKPFSEYFESMSDFLDREIDPETASRHYLRLLSAYITKTGTKREITDDDIALGVTIFLRGIVKSECYNSVL